MGRGLSARRMEPCPLGARCPDSGRHRALSRVMDEHQVLALNQRAERKQSMAPVSAVRGVVDPARPPQEVPAGAVAHVPDDGWDPADGPHPTGGYDEVKVTATNSSWLHRAGQDEGDLTQVEFLRDGARHREDGPARLAPGRWADGEEYWLDGRPVDRRGIAHRLLSDEVMTSVPEAVEWDRVTRETFGAYIGDRHENPQVVRQVKQLRERGADPVGVQAWGERVEQLSRPEDVADKPGRAPLREPELELMVRNATTTQAAALRDVDREDPKVAVALFGDGQATPEQLTERRRRYAERIGQSYRPTANDRRWTAEVVAATDDDDAVRDWTSYPMTQHPAGWRRQLLRQDPQLLEGGRPDPQRLTAAREAKLNDAEHVRRVLDGEPVEWVTGYAGKKS